MNLASFAILLAVVLAAVVALVLIFRGRRRCNSSCEACSFKDNCKKL